jgi:hypothetical protein
MTETVSLTIKINPTLKDHIKQQALDNQVSMSQEIASLLQTSLQTPAQPGIDSQDTEEVATEQLNAAELKLIRALLKKQGKKKK